MVKRFMAPGPWITRDLKECVRASDYDVLAAERDALRQRVELLLGVIDAREARLAEAEALAKELRIRYHAAGRRPEECYEMSLIDAFLAADSPSTRPIWEREPPHCPTCDCGAAGSADDVTCATVYGGPVQHDSCCLDYPRCDCNSPPEPDNAPALQPCGHPWKAQHDFKCILCSSPG